MPATETNLRELVDRAFKYLMDKDQAGFIGLVAEDAVFFDPHYPVQRMVGKAAINDGITWGLGSMEQMGFKVEKFFTGEDGHSAAVEIATAHVLKGGKKLNFPQAFVFEVKDGLITRLQAYEPYPPGGVVGLFLGVNRLVKKFKK